MVFGAISGIELLLFTNLGEKREDPYIYINYMNPLLGNSLAIFFSYFSLPLVSISYLLYISLSFVLPSFSPLVKE